MDSSRVVHVGPSTSAHGGIARVIDGLLSSELADRYELESVGTLSGHRGLLRFTAFPAALLRLAWIFALLRPAAVHVHTASWGSFPRKRAVVALAHWFRVPVILHVHGGGFVDYMSERHGRERAVRRVLEKCAAAIVLSEPLRASLTALAPHCTIWTIPNAVEVPEATAHGIASEQVVFAGRPVAEKGILELLEAATTIAAKRPSFTLAIAGDDTDRQISSTLRGTPLEARVRLHGWLDHVELYQLYDQSSVFVLPSHVEAMPLSLLEAMSHGLACVVTPVGAVPQVVTDGFDGTVVPVGDALALERALERLLDDEPLRRRLGGEARATIERRYSMEHAVELIGRVYASCGVEERVASRQIAIISASDDEDESPSGDRPPESRDE